MDEDIEFMDREFEEMIDEPDNEMFAPEVEYIAERNFLERANVNQIDNVLRVLIGGGGEIGKKLEDINKRLFTLSAPPDEKFKILVSVMFATYKDELQLSFKDFDILIEKIDYLENISYKNPLAYILGYYTIDKNSINKKRFENVCEIVLKTLDYIKPPDVIRYGRMWLKLLK